MMPSIAELIQRIFVPCETEDHSGAPALLITIECEQCGELIRARIDKAHELQDIYGDDDRPVGYLLVKELVGANCQNVVRLKMEFDKHQRPTNLEVTGGELVHMECTD